MSYRYTVDVFCDGKLPDGSDCVAWTDGQASHDLTASRWGADNAADDKGWHMTATLGGGRRHVCPDCWARGER